MTTFRIGQDVAVVEHDDATRKPREGGRVVYTSVSGTNSVFTTIKDERRSWDRWPILFDTGSGWAAHAEYDYRLVPVCERCDDPILGEPVIHPAGPGPGHIYCGSDCEDATAEAWHEMHYREA